MKLTIEQLKRLVNEALNEHTWDAYYEREAAGPDVDDSLDDDFDVEDEDEEYFEEPHDLPSNDWKTRDPIDDEF